MKLFRAYLICPVFWIGRRLTAFARLVVLILALVAAAQTRAETTREFQVKAVLIFNLVQFVEWPASAFESTNSPIVIGVMDNRDHVGKLLKEVVRDEVIRGRRVVVEHCDSVKDATRCHVLYVAGDERPRFDAILSKLDARPILTVSESESFVRAGGMIRMFAKPDGKIGLRINPNAAKNVGLTVSAKLLRLAEIVGPEEARK